MRKDRLLKLAEHLESGNLGHDVFDFDKVTVGERKANGCGTAGCALGECLVAFPNDWKLRQGIGTPVPIIEGEYFTFKSAEVFFEITPEQSRHLFVPYNQKLPMIYGGKQLHLTAKPHDVASNIRAFVESNQNMGLK